MPPRILRLLQPRPIGPITHPGLRPTGEYLRPTVGPYAAVRQPGPTYVADTALRADSYYPPPATFRSALDVLDARMAARCSLAVASM